MKVLVACEFSGIVRDAFATLGHDAWSCDLLPTDRPGQHIQGDVLLVIEDQWDMILAFPPCTHLAVSGAAWFARKEMDGRQQAGMDFFMRFARHSCQRIAIENPVGIMSSRWREPDQIVNPYEFGDPVTKATCLWLKGLQKLRATHHVAHGERTVFASGRSMPTWYADAWRLPAEQRATVRSKTFQGIADAMADQWGGQQAPKMFYQTSIFDTATDQEAT